MAHQYRSLLFGLAIFLRDFRSPVACAIPGRLDFSLAEDLILDAGSE